MVECMNPALPISQQCRLLVLPRSSVYRKLAEVDAEDLAIMALIDRHYLVRPITARAGWRHGWRPKAIASTARGAAPDAAVGTGGDLPAPEYEQAGSGTQD